MTSLKLVTSKRTAKSNQSETIRRFYLDGASGAATPNRLQSVKLYRSRHAGDKVERIYSSNSFLTSALDEMSGQSHVPAVLATRERTQVSTGREAGWASKLVWKKKLQEEPIASARDRTRWRGSPICCQTLY
jgi:hypothetical protein